MSTCVRLQAELWRGRLQRGDVLVTNHPEYGGTHLPDITVITPAFSDDNGDGNGNNDGNNDANSDGGRIIFYVASRAHHADIGGILPGSMPPHSRELADEGAAIASEKLVEAGRFNEARVVELLRDAPARHAGSSGTRSLADNLSDLQAQAAANRRGLALIGALVAEHGVGAVQRYMRAIQANAEQSVRRLLRGVARRARGRDLRAVDYMDDGSAIRLRVRIDADKGEALFDFTGTGAEVYGQFFFKPPPPTPINTKNLK